MPESKQSNKVLYCTLVIAILALVVSIFTAFTGDEVGTEVGTSAVTTISNLTVRNGITAGHSGFVFNSDTNATTMTGSLSVSGSCFTNTTSNMVVGKNLTAGTGGGFKFVETTNATTLAGALTVGTTIGSGAITSTGSSQVAELNITGAAVATKVLCAKADGGIGQCSDNASTWTAGNCTCA